MSNSPNRTYVLYRVFPHFTPARAQETMNKTLVKTKATIGFLGPGEIGWTVDTGGPRARSFGT